MAEKLPLSGNGNAEQHIDEVRIPVAEIGPKDGTRHAGEPVHQPDGTLPRPRIEPELAEPIIVGAGGKLIVPREDLDSDMDEGAEIDLVNLQAKKIRKPGRREWIRLNLGLELPTRLLLVKPRPDAIETDYYYVAKPLRGPIRDELKDVRVLPYYSVKARTVALWIVNVTPDNPWYQSVAQLLNQPADFLAGHVFLVMSDKANGRYRVRYKDADGEVTWPTKTTEELLGEALGPERFIDSADHPVYRELIEGTELA